MLDDKISFWISSNPKQTLNCCSIPPSSCLLCLIRNSLFNPNNFHRYVSLIKGGQTLLRGNVKSSIKIRNGKKLLSLCNKDFEIKGSYLWEQLPYFLSFFLLEKYEGISSQVLIQGYHYGKSRVQILNPSLAQSKIPKS